MSTQTGHPAVNSEVLSVINDMIGRIIRINTTDKKRYSGVLCAVSPDFQFGLKCVVELTKKNENNLLRAEEEVIEKMSFHFTDVVDFAYCTEDDKKNHFVNKFTTDRQYHGEALPDEDLEEWKENEEDDCLGGSIEDDVVTNGSQNIRRNNHNNGWSVNDMFAVNEKMNVVSTFKDDLTQYTTVEVVGTDEDRARADQLAREIESSVHSKFMANLENDDDERDLDKITTQQDFDNGNNQRGGKRNNYNQQPQQRRNQNMTPNGQPVNRRAEGLRGDRRNSGSSSANNSRYNPPVTTQNYQQQPPQQQHGQKSGNYNNRRQNDDYRENDWQMAKGKGQNQGQDHSFRQQQKQMLDPRPSAKQPEADKGQSSGSRVADLKNWSNEFSIATSPKEMSPAPGHTPPAPQGNSGSAWNRGPPSSLVAKGSTTETVSPSTENNVPVSETSKTATQKKEEVPSTSGGEAQNESDAPQEDRDDVSVTDRSETSSVITTKSSSFKFNINAPEFKPRVAPSTPTPTTPTGPTPQNMNHIPQQHHQYIPPASQYQQPMIPQGQPIGVAGMVPHMGPGGIPQNQGHVVAWQQGQQSYPQNQQFQMQQVTMQGVPGQMYGPAATAPTSVSQAAPINQQIPTSTSGGPPTDGNQINAPARREGEYREAQPMFYSYPQAPMVQVPQQFYHQQYQGAVPQPYQMKVMPQGPQGAYQPRFQQPYMIPQGQNPQQIIQGPPQQAHQFAGEQVAPQSHPNSQPTTPGPRGEMNGPKNQQGPPQAQNGNNGMHREPEAGSNASLSGSASSQSGQRSGSPQTNAPVQQQQHQQAPTHSGLQHGGPPHATGPPPHMMQQPQFMIVPHQMHSQIPNYYQQQQQMYYSTMMVPQQMHMQPNQHGQQSLMGERADTGYAHNNIFDYRKMPNYQQNQQQSHNQQMHGGHMPRQNSIPQQYGATQSVNSSSQQAPPTASQQQQQQQQQGGPPREQQQQSQPSQPQAQSPQ